MSSSARTLANATDTLESYVISVDRWHNRSTYCTWSKR